jgi:hypothetical protein
MAVGDVLRWLEGQLAPFEWLAVGPLIHERLNRCLWMPHTWIDNGEASWMSPYSLGWKCCSLICCERKMLFVSWKSTVYKSSEQSVCFLPPPRISDVARGVWPGDALGDRRTRQVGPSIPVTSPCLICTCLMKFCSTFRHSNHSPSTSGTRSYETNFSTYDIVLHLFSVECRWSNLVEWPSTMDMGLYGRGNF